MKTAMSKTTTKGIRYLWLPFLILAAVRLAGCSGLEEDVITREEIAAAKAYDPAAEIYHGKFVNLNFPESYTVRTNNQ